MVWKEGSPRGVFKKILISEESRLLESETLASFLKNFQIDWEYKRKPESEIAFEITLLYLKSRFGKKAYLSTGTIVPDCSETLPFLEAVRFYGLPDTIRQTLLHWNRGDWPIKLVDTDPDSEAMLEAQSRGYRLACFRWDLSFTGELTEEGRDSIEHLFHDLAHAFMFFREDYDPKGQIAFFSKMKEELPDIQAQYLNDSIFQEKLKYCISDMNSHPAHLSAYWKAIQKEAKERAKC